MIFRIETSIGVANQHRYNEFFRHKVEIINETARQLANQFY